MISPILRQLDGPNAFSLVGMGVSFGAVAMAFQGRFHLAFLGLMLAGVIDLFDGFLARRATRTPLQSEVGKQLDSLVDVCSFGFAPALVAYAYGLKGWELIILLGFVACAALRLAYFNATGLASEGDDHYFTGMPVTYVGLYVPLIFVSSLWVDISLMRGILVALYGILAAAMVSPFRVPKPRGAWYVIFACLALALSVVYLTVMGR